MSAEILIRPTEADLQHWMRSFVPSTMLWWWDNSPIPNPSVAPRVIARSELRTDQLASGIRYVNAFHSWAISTSATRIIIDDGAWIDSLNAPQRQRVSEFQVQLNRGLCVPSNRFAEATDLPMEVIFEERVVLDQHLWAALPEESRRAVIESELADWDRDTTYPVPEGTDTHIADVANTFVLQDGVNCLAVTAFALTADPEDLHQWMMPDVFLDILRDYGYSELRDGSPLAGDVIVFRNAESGIVHAAYVLEPDRLLNKSGQTSFNPISLLDMAMVKADWLDYAQSIFRR